MTGVCAACGAMARLGPDGVCAWRAGCEHRQAQTEAAGRALDRALAAQPLPVRETPAEPMHPYDRDLADYYRRAVDAYGGPVCVHCTALAN